MVVKKSKIPNPKSKTNSKSEIQRLKTFLVILILYFEFV